LKSPEFTSGDLSEIEGPPARLLAGERRHRIHQSVGSAWHRAGAAGAGQAV